jgi:hypothetical protein
MLSKEALVAETFVVDAKGKRTAVILPMDRYEELMEDMQDLRIVAERKGEKPISANAMTKRLKKRGLV